MNSIDEAKQKLQKLESKSTFEKMLQVAAILTKLLENRRIRPVIEVTKSDLTSDLLEQWSSEIY